MRLDGARTGGYKPTPCASQPMTDDDLDPLPDGAAEFVERVIEERHGYLAWLGTQVESIERGRAVLHVPYDEKLATPTSPPTVHGGVAATLLDTAGGIALRTCLPDPTAGGVATVNLNVNYLRRATGGLTATAEVVRAGGSIGVAAVDVESTTPEGAEAAVATGQGAYRLFRDRDDGVGEGH